MDSFDLGTYKPVHIFLQFHDLILCIISALEARDPYTSHHSSRVAEMTEKICEIIGLNEWEKEICHIAAHLHDIGKIGIRDYVLLKKGELNDEEWEAMKSHSVTGYNILMKANSFEVVARVVRSHHERFDGKGYPDGLKGVEIPLGARIIAIADSIDAMISDRPYRKGMDTNVCKEQIAKNSGIMYDPAITAKVLEHWEEVLKSREDESNSCIANGE